LLNKQSNIIWKIAALYKYQFAFSLLIAQLLACTLVFDPPGAPTAKKRKTTQAVKTTPHIDYGKVSHFGTDYRKTP
jgi:hypothetical protein